MLLLCFSIKIVDAFRVALGIYSESTQERFVWSTMKGYWIRGSCCSGRGGNACFDQQDGSPNYCKKESRP